MQLHHAASKYDVGIYFESNGHGTVLFSQIFHELVRSRRDNETRRQTVARKRLAALARIMNPSVGDALSDLLAVMGVLYLGGNGTASAGRWAGMYRDRPTRQRQVRVGDRGVVMTNATETRVTSPSILQRVLDLESRAMARGGAGGAGLPPRCFVRPSGTEDEGVRRRGDAERCRRAVRKGTGSRIWNMWGARRGAYGGADSYKPPVTFF